MTGFLHPKHNGDTGFHYKQKEIGNVDNLGRLKEGIALQIAYAC